MIIVPIVTIEGEAMTAELTIRVDAESGAPFIRNCTSLEKFDDGPQKYVDLKYSETDSTHSLKIEIRALIESGCYCEGGGRITTLCGQRQNTTGKPMDE
jgi:hypothetical protein